MDENEYFNTIQGQFIAGAQRYLTAAQVLCGSKEWRRGRLLQTPALHLLAHAICSLRRKQWQLVDQIRCGSGFWSLGYFACHVLLGSQVS
jgi:hypothetical protein